MRTSVDISQLHRPAAAVARPALRRAARGEAAAGRRPGAHAPRRTRTATALDVQIQRRLAFPLASLLLALVAVPLGIRPVRAGRSMGALTAIGVMALYWVLFSLGEMAAERGVGPAWLGLWRAEPDRARARHLAGAARLAERLVSGAQRARRAARLRRPPRRRRDAGLRRRAGERARRPAARRSRTRASACSRARPRRGRGAAPSVALRRDVSVILRRYQHGGVFGGFTGMLHLGLSRALEELRVTARAEASGAPVPHVVCLALWPAAGPFWSALIGTREERGARDLYEVLVATRRRARAPAAAARGRRGGAQAARRRRRPPRPAAPQHPGRRGGRPAPHRRDRPRPRHLPLERPAREPRCARAAWAACRAPR